MNRVRYSTKVAFCIGLIVAAILPTSGRAVNIVVGSITYDVKFDTGASFNDNQGLIQASPWWDDATLANDFAAAYGGQVSPFTFDVNPGTSGDNFLLFAHSFPNANDVESRILIDDGSLASFILPRTFTSSDGFYAFAATPVPEIDGGALGQGR